MAANAVYSTGPGISEGSGNNDGASTLHASEKVESGKLDSRSKDQQLSNTEAFMKRPKYQDISAPGNLSTTYVRENFVYPGTTVTIPLPNIPMMYNPHLSFDLVMIFPWVQQALPAVEAVDWAPSDNQWLNTMANIKGSNFVGGDSTQELDENSLYYAGLKAAGLTTVTGAPVFNSGSYGTGDWKCDPSTGNGHCDLFSQVSLVKGGIVVDNYNTRYNGEPFHMVNLATKSGKTLQMYDIANRSNILQCAPGIEPGLVPDENVLGTRRASSAIVDYDKKTIRITQRVQMPVPLRMMRNLPVSLIGSHDLILTLNPVELMGLTAATRYYSGHMNNTEYALMNVPITEEGAFNAFAGIPLSSAGVGYGASKIQPFSDYGFIPSIPGPTTGGLRKSGEGCAFHVVLNALFLDTHDLEEIMGAPQLVLPGNNLDDNYVPRNHPNQTLVSYPMCSMLNNGFTAWFRVSNIDSADTQYVPQANFSTNKDGQNSVSDAALIRDAWVKVPFFPTDILSIALGSLTTIGRDNLATPLAPQTVNIVNTVQSGTQAVDDKSIGNRGQVVIQLATPKIIEIPIYGGDYSGVQWYEAVNGDFIAVNVPTFLSNIFDANFSDGTGYPRTTGDNHRVIDNTTLQVGVEFRLGTNLYGFDGFPKGNARTQLAPVMKWDPSLTTTGSQFYSKGPATPEIVPNVGWPSCQTMEFLFKI